VYVHLIANTPVIQYTNAGMEIKTCQNDRSAFLGLRIRET